MDVYHDVHENSLLNGLRFINRNFEKPGKKQVV